MQQPQVIFHFMHSYKRYFYFLFLLQFSSFLASAQTGKIDSTEMVTLRIDPQNASGASVSQIFDEVKFIPLETTKESLFGRINTLKVLKDYFLIFDNDTKAILIFHKDGKYKTKINASKITQDKDDKSKTEFYGFLSEEINKQTYIKIYTQKYCYYFDLDGKQVKKILNKDAPYNRDIKFADSVTTVRPGYIYKNGKDSIFHEVGIIHQKKDSIGYFPFDMKRYQTDEFWGNGERIYNYGVPNELFYINFYSYNLYKITPSKVSLAYRIIFPANNSLPIDFTTNPIYIKKRGEYFRNNPKVFYGISGTYLFGDNLYLKMSNYGFEQGLKKDIIHNIKTGQATSIADLEPDERSSFLPVTDASGNFYDFKNRGFHLFEDGYLYTSYSSLAMFSFKEQLGDKHNSFSPEMKEYFKTQNKKSNPIIIQLRPKKD